MLRGGFRYGIVFLPVAALAAVVAFACSGPANLRDFGQSSGMSGDSGNPTTLPDGAPLPKDPSGACTSYATAKCAKFDACTNGFYVKTHFDSMDQCIEREKLP